MSILDSYLQKLQKDESIFPMDQFATKNQPLDSSPKDPVDKKDKKKRHLKNIFPENAPPHKKRAMIDFDETIHKYSKRWHDGTPYDPPFEGARDAVQFLKSIGFEIVIFTARLSSEGSSDSNEQKRMLEEWFDKYDIPYDKMTAEKLPAEFYIDDRAIRIENGNWDLVIQLIKDRMGLSEEF